MYNQIKRQIRGQLAHLKTVFPDDYRALAKAWAATKRWTAGGEPPGADGVLIPYVGSGLNSLAPDGVTSWKRLVELVATACGGMPSPYRVRRSGLSFPQQLEILLRRAQGTKQPAVRRAFQKAFDTGTQPSEFHRRLMRMFPILITTNYNTLLSDADEAPGRPCYDLTDDAVPLPTDPLQHRAVFHIHGVWDPNDDAHQEERLFAGVGRDSGGGQSRLILSEHQYYRHYARHDFKRVVEQLLSRDSLLLFLGASLSNDEAGIHSVLTARALSERHFTGLYIGLDLDPLKAQLLEIRGLHAIELYREFGFSRDGIEPLFHGLLDVLEEELSDSPHRLATPAPHCLFPNIVCVGLASYNRVLSLGQKDIGAETSHAVPASNMAEEAGGQHLYAALHLVDRGYRVALVTALGDDEYGDRVLKEACERIEKLPNHHSGDLLTHYVLRTDSTRLSSTVTFKGTRVIFDYDKNPLPLDFDQPIDAWGNPEALYLGGYFPGMQERILAQFEETVNLRFFESGTTGHSDPVKWARVMGIARRCTHVLVSSAFLLKLSGEVSLGTDLSTTNCQDWLMKDWKQTTRMVETAWARLWGTAPTAFALVVLMGRHGSAVADAHPAVRTRHVPAIPVPDELGKNWLGCGDLFRAEFIHQILGNPSIDLFDAATAASQVVAERIQRMSFLPPMP